MKRALVFLFTVCLLLNFSACSGQSGATEQLNEVSTGAGSDQKDEPGASTAIAPVTGFRYFRSNDIDVQFQYPVRWVEVNAENIDDGLIASRVSENFGLNIDKLREQLVDGIYHFYDEANSEYASPAYLALSRRDSGGFTSENFATSDIAAYYKNNMDTSYEELYSGFDWEIQPKMVRYELVPGILLKFTYLHEEKTIEVLQFMTVVGRSICTFCYTSVGSVIDDELTTQLEQVFGTIETI